MLLHVRSHPRGSAEAMASNLARSVFGFEVFDHNSFEQVCPQHMACALPHREASHSKAQHDSAWLCTHPQGATTVSQTFAGARFHARAGPKML